MAIVLSDALARAILETGYDSAFNDGTLEIRTGAPPGPGQTPSGTLLASIAVGADFMAAASGRSKAKNGTWQANGVGAGNAGHYRLKDDGDTAAATQNEKRQEGTITATGGGGDMTIDNVSIAVGQQVTITAFDVSM